MTALHIESQTIDLNRGVIGASEAPAAIGVDPWRPPVRLFLEKTGRVTRTDMSQAAQWGTILEPVVRGVYVQAHACEIHVPAESLYHPSIPWLRATPDGIVIVDGEWSHGLEVKCPGLRMAPSWESDDGRTVPVWYHVQAAVQMAVTGLPRVDFAVLLGGQEYFETTVYRDLDLESSILEGLATFKDLLDRDEMPAIDDSEDYRRHLLAKIRPDSVEAIATPRLNDLAAKWRDLVRSMKTLKADEDLVRNHVAAEMATMNASKVKTTLGRIAITVGKTERDWKALAADYATQLQTRGVPVDLDEDIGRFTTYDPTARSIRRPPSWTKDDAND